MVVKKKKKKKKRKNNRTHIKKIGPVCSCKFFLLLRNDAAQRESAVGVGGGGGGVGHKGFLLRVTLSGSQEEEICLFSVIFRRELQEALLHYLATARPR